MEQTSKALLLLLLLSSSSLACIHNVHITLGDYFANQSAAAIYRVGFTTVTFQDADCVAGVKLVVTFPDKTTATYATTNDTRNYSFHGLAQSNVPTAATGGQVDIDRTFGFIELTKLTNMSEFTYRFEYKGQVVRGPYSFKTRILNKNNDFKVVAFGDHDELAGSTTITQLAKADFDLIVLTGDYAFDIHSNNGARGDTYFDAMEPLFTRVPVVLAPGSREFLDNYNLFASKFIFPLNKTETSVSNYHFVVNNTLFITLNFDLIFLDKDAYNAALVYLKATLDKYAQDKTINHRIFFANRPFICSNQNTDVDGTQTTCNVYPLLLKQFNDVLQQYNVQLVLSGNQLYYERSHPLYNLNTEDDGIVYVIAGTGGNSLKVADPSLSKAEYKAVDLQKILGFVALDITTDKIHGDFIGSNDGSKLDSFDIGSKPWYKRPWVWILAAILAALAGIGAFMGMRRPNRGYKPMDDRVVEERREVRYDDGTVQQQNVRTEVRGGNEVRREYKTELVDNRY